MIIGRKDLNFDTSSEEYDDYESPEDNLDKLIDR